MEFKTSNKIRQEEMGLQIFCKPILMKKKKNRSKPSKDFAESVPQDFALQKSSNNWEKIQRLI